MPKRITITPHLSVDDLAQRYRQAKSPIERSHYQIIWLLAQGKHSEEVVEVTGYSRNWIYELVRDYNANGSHSSLRYWSYRITREEWQPQWTG